MDPTQTRRRFLQSMAACAATLGFSRRTASNGLRAFCSEPSKAIPFEEYSQHDALGLARLVKLGEVTPSELLESAIQRAEAVHERLNAIVGDREILYEHARRSIANGLSSGPFTGVPFVIKDLSFSMQGVECSQGSKLFSGVKADKDCAAVARYRRAGLVIFARTHSPEFGIMPATESALHGVTRNPWNLERTAGGSSGGTAAAVASGVVPAGSGSDGGGSIRIPASCCGLFGLKPTRERIPTDFSEYGGIVSVHALTRSVRDSAALLDVTRGPVPGMTGGPPVKTGSYLAEVSRHPQRLKIGVALRTPFIQTLHPDCRAAVDETIKLCESLGHVVEDVTDDFVRCFAWEQLLQAQLTFFVGGLVLNIRRRLADLGRDLKTDDVEPGTYELLKTQQDTAADFGAALRVSADASRRMAVFMDDFDVLVTSTLGKPPIGHGILTTQKQNVDIPEAVSFIPFTFLANFTGIPAMSVPLYWSQEGLPIGVQFMGRYADEATLFRLAGQLEAAQPWNDKRPPALSAAT